MRGSGPSRAGCNRPEVDDGAGLDAPLLEAPAYSACRATPATRSDEGGNLLIAPMRAEREHSVCSGCCRAR